MHAALPQDITLDGLEGLESLDGTGTHGAPFDAFNPLSYHGHLSAPGHEVPTAQPLADPMDLDLDFDAVWAGDLDPMGHLQPNMALTYCPPMTAMPADFLFAEDEEVLPAGPCYTDQQTSHASTNAGMPQAQMQPPEPSPTRGAFSAARSDAGSEDAKLLGDGSQDGMAHERLRRQLSLLSKGWAGDEIRFKNCDPSKAVVLHALAMELGLGYNHDVMSREVSMARLGPAQVASKPQASPRRLSSSLPLPRSSTELDSALCLPGLPAVPEFQTLDLASNQTIKEQAAVQAVQSGVMSKEQQLTRRPSRSERITDSISKHVSTLKTSIAKGGRRGPLTENGRRDMRALEAAGGACWRCKVLRRKVSYTFFSPFDDRCAQRANTPQCDPGSPCRCCLQSVPMPHLGEDAPLWPLIGCRRGPLRESISPQLLCPGPKPPQHRGAGTASAPTRRCPSVDVAERCLLSAESQRLADMKAVLEGASYKLSITDPALKTCFSSFIEEGQYRDRLALQRSYTSRGRSVTYTELIAIIAWELAENQVLLSSLEIKSWESFISMLETAGIYESEVGQVS